MSFSHRDPLEGEVIMDATARLLAAKPVYQYYKPGAAHGKRGKGDKKPKAQAQPAKPQPRKRRPRPPRRPRPERPPRRGRPPRRRRGLGRSADRLPAPAGAEGASRPGWSRPRAGRRTPLSRRV
ncbi:MAG: hypothetical protein ACLSCQ_07260 [Evtepia gabavorous]